MIRKRQGFVLISVLWVVALLTIVTISYHHRARLEVRASRYSLDSSQARLAARAAVVRATLELENKAAVELLSQVPGQTPRPASTHLGQSWAREHDLFQPGNALYPGEGFERDVARYRIEDMERYININGATEDLLAALPGMSRPVARRIHYRLVGSPDDEDMGQSFHLLSELRDIRGVDDKTWYGDDQTPGLRDVLTVYGDGRVNINTAPATVLQSLPDVAPEAVDVWLQVRRGDDGEEGTEDDRGVSTWEEFREWTEITGDSLIAFQRFCKFNSNCFKISALATRRGGVIRSECTAIISLPDGSNTANLLSWSEESLGSP